ncbi:MAG: sigma-70 family RNA polymerase sigma factor, partial [Planctomycetes bacterium]|nr:sigma-70 family RNA polymerase sigma factor [Planctomycetota bacterium]
AVENFDYARGTKFSTYGSWAIMKNFARSIPEEHYHCKRYVTGQNEVLSDVPDKASGGVPASDKKRVREIIAEGMSELSEREREIVTDRFGLSGSGNTMTLEQLGQRFGVTRERIRQIERRALKRLGEFLSPSLIDALAV